MSIFWNRFKTCSLKLVFVVFWNLLKTCSRFLFQNQLVSRRVRAEARRSGNLGPWTSEWLLPSPQATDETWCRENVNTILELFNTFHLSELVQNQSKFTLLQNILLTWKNLHKNQFNFLSVFWRTSRLSGGTRRCDDVFRFRFWNIGSAVTPSSSTTPTTRRSTSIRQKYVLNILV